MEIELISFGRALLFLGLPLFPMIFFFQWQWAKTCRTKIRVLVAEKGGGGRWEYANKDGGFIEIKTHDGESRMWPVNELATIDVPYPGVGWVPLFLQKQIRLAFVNEGDMEPLLNRSPHRNKIASPDVMDYIRQNMVDAEGNLSDEVKHYLDGLSTGPTREVIADPAALGALQRSGVLQALASVSDDIMKALNGVSAQLTRVAGPKANIVYVGLAMAILLTGYGIFLIMQMTPLNAELIAAMEKTSVAEVINKLDAIQTALGVTP